MPHGWAFRGPGEARRLVGPLRWSSQIVERAVVDQLDLHHLAEPARRDLDAQLAERGREPEVEALRELQGRGAGEAGTATPPRVGIERELRDDEGAPPTSTSDRFVLPSSSSKIRSSVTRRAKASATVSVSEGPTPNNTTSPGPIFPTTEPSTRTRAGRPLWSSARTIGYGSFGGSFQP